MSHKNKIKSLIKAIRIYYLLKFRIRPRTVGINFYCGYKNIIKKKTLEIGDNVYIGNSCFFSIDKISIDNYVMIASQVSIVGGDHRFDIVGVPIKETGRCERSGVAIGKDCW